MVQNDISTLLTQLTTGDREALNRLVPAIRGELEALANRELDRTVPDHTLSATAVVHESYLKLAELDELTWQARAHFGRAAAGVMRRLLTDSARERARDHRPETEVPLEDVIVAARDAPTRLLALDRALDALAELNARQAAVVECRFFGGMGVEDTAEALGVGVEAARADWTVARAWLNRELMRR